MRGGDLCTAERRKMTNKEYLNSLTSKQFAEWFCEHNRTCRGCPARKPNRACRGPQELEIWLMKEKEKTDG